MVFGVKREIQKVKNGKQVVHALDVTNTLFAHSYCLFRDIFVHSFTENLHTARVKLQQTFKTVEGMGRVPMRDEFDLFLRAFASSL